MKKEIKIIEKKYPDNYYGFCEWLDDQERMDTRWQITSWSIAIVFSSLLVVLPILAHVLENIFKFKFIQ